MSSFRHPHALYLFDMTNGRRKLAYGRSPADALEILAMRLKPHEMAAIIADRCEKIAQRDLQKYVDRLG